ncbi:Rossmann fold domain-containing protein [Aurantiacibacter aquimixticola]|uniref:Short chain dehydrogenase-like proteobacteria domain-containing protein n=1 Tax=Aurantiacibacter aquimixticola TaxID=1958945 RepID=A0A419RQG5_9SPHN|nr:hypothetical protein [Aurantiacibacter aquimixticola]RJY08006.1 hypothetical protein D6201_00340 [Aurantiacibacter aquimixticola]
MSAHRLEARGLPEAPLDAAAAFSTRLVAEARALAPGDLVILFDHADHTHDSWRRAAVEELAREGVPGRVNAVVGPAGEGLEQAATYLERAPGVTGQIFSLA